MHYYYDLLVNLDTELWEFYEWKEDDSLVKIKKIPFIRVSEKDIYKFFAYQIQLEKEFFQKYENKVIWKNKKEKSTCILFSSTKHAIVLEFDESGKSIFRSQLLVEDENNCNEVAHSLEKTEVFYKTLEKLPIRHYFRQEEEEKHLILVELDTIKETKNSKKCSYLYYEYFGILEKDLGKMLADFEVELKKEYNSKIHKIVKLIRLSYKETL